MSKPQTIVVLGAQWGDEGKGKICDYYAKDVDYVVRFQGGNNAGHTLVVNGEVHKLHLLPSGILHHNKRIVIGNGMVIDLKILLSEIEHYKNKGINPNLLISERAHVILPQHIISDGQTDEAKGKLAAGTTRRGVGPCYADKMKRVGLRIIDLLNKKNTLAQKIKKYVGDVSLELNQAINQGKKILFEGAQGTMLDIDHGVYPYTTSSNTTAGGVCTGTGISPKKIDKIIGVVKAYTSRVGQSPFPTEATKKDANYLRQKGNEYGTTTGRPRRCGWLDFVQLRYAQRINNFDCLAITKIDVLNGLKKIPICTKYRYKNKTITEMPADLEIFRQVKPVYEYLSGWPKTPFPHLPVNMKKYLQRIEKEMQVPIKLISLGADRKTTIQC